MIRFFFVLLLLYSIPLQAQNRIEELKFQLDKMKEESNSTNRESLMHQEEQLIFKLVKEYLVLAGFPIMENEGEIIHHQAYSLSYNENHEQANWVMHVITPEMEGKNFGRSVPYSSDSLVKTGTAEKEDYELAGIDRGHLAPSADFDWSTRAKDECYLYSNVAPQQSALNRGLWREMENSLRNYSISSNHHLVVVTGGVLTNGLPDMGYKSQISIPEYFYKVAIDMDDTLHPCIAYLFPNKNAGGQISDYALSVDSLESLLKIDFFSSLEKANIESAEKLLQPYLWQGKSYPEKQVPNRVITLQPSINQKEGENEKETGNQSDR